MKQIVPFTRKIDFDTSVDEVTSISLDKTIKNIEDNIISGIFDLYLEYKESDISVNILKYESQIPFDIDIDTKYSLKDVKVEIDDFYYEIDDDSILLHIDVLIDNLELNEEELESVIVKHDDREDISIEDVISYKDDTNEDIEDNTNEDDYYRKDDEIKIENLFKEIDEEIKDVKVEPKIPLFETFNPEKETYVTYTVHIVREEDTVDTICTKYNVNKEDLEYYNDISVIKLGDKLIVPTYKK